MTTFSRTLFTSSLVVAAIALVGPAARAEVMTDGPSAQTRSTGAAPFQQLAQKVDDDKIKKGKERAKGGDNAKKPDANAARQNANKARQDAVKAKQDAARARQDAAKAAQKGAQEKAVKARQDAIKAKQDAQASRAKAIQDKQNAAKAKAQAAKAQQDAARTKAIKAKQDAEAQRARAIKDKQNAAKAQQDAARAKQEALRAKAIKEKQEAEAARAKAIKAKQDAVKDRRQDALKDRQDALKDRRDAVKDRQDAIKAKQAAARKAKYDRAKADQEFERARKRAQERKGGGRDEKWTPAAANRFETLRKGRKTREVGSRDIIIEPDKRVIIRNEKRVFIRHDDRGRFERKGRRELRRERRKDGLITAVTMGLAGALIYSVMDDEGRVVRRSRRDRDGREYVFFDNRRSYHHGPGQFGGGDYRESYIDLPPPVVRIPRDRYIVDYDQASPDDIYDALNSPPIEPLDRGYTLDEVRQNYSILERMRRVDLDAINFEFASWEVPPEEYPKLERLARAIQRVLDQSPSEMFMIEGHTDAVGDDVDNLSLSDRRAESVAVILSDNFGIPPENLTTQGFGEEYLKEQTEEPSWINRRVSVRRVTPLLSQEGWNDPE